MRTSPCTGCLPSVIDCTLVLDGLRAVARLVRDDDLRGLSRGERRVEEPDEEHPGDPAADLGGDEHRGGRRRDAGEGVGERAPLARCFTDMDTASWANIRWP